MKVAMLNISIGNYDIFWKDFYLTSKQNFLPNAEKHYFVFTDNNELYGVDFEDITLIYQENLGWPFNTMKRFAMFKRIIDHLEHFDYIFFVNGNALFLEELNENFINPDKNLITIVHPGLYGRTIDAMPYERNVESKAYIPKGEGKYYVQGAFIGGKSKPFISMIEKLDEDTTIDLNNGIVAVWHDESFLNRYILGRTDVQIMGRQYLYYQEYVFPWKPVILLRNKRNYGNLAAFRGENSKKDVKIIVKLKLKRIKDRMLIKLKIHSLLENIKKDGTYVDIDLNR